MANMISAIQSLTNNAEFVISNDDYSTIIWHNLEGDAPTLTQIEAEIKRLDKLEINAQLIKNASRQSALDKLSALGLTPDEANAIISA